MWPRRVAMSCRFKGFVVGRRTVRQQRGWRIGRRTHQGSKVVYFVPEAEIAEGLRLQAGAEVTFSTEMRGGRLHALNVQPKPATTMEDSMRRLKWGLIAALFLAIVAVVGVFKPHHQDPIRGWIVEARAETIMRSIRLLTANDIISDGVLRAVMNPGHTHASRAAREAVFRVNQCRMVSIGFKDPDETCYDALYWEGRDDHWVSERTGIPSRVTAEFFPEARATIYQTVRTHLASPQNLRAMYDARKGVIMTEFRRQTPARQMEFLSELSGGIRAFIQFQTNAGARLAYEDYLRAYAAWLATWQGQGGTETEKDMAFASLKEAEETLSPMVNPFYIFLFAGRRFAEGGDGLVSEYISIMQDLQATLTR